MQTDGCDEQGECGRSTAGVARALQKSRNVIGRIKREKRWGARMLGHETETGEDAQEFAARMYRARFLPSHGREELPSVVHLVLPALLRIAQGARIPPAAGTSPAEEAAVELLGHIEGPEVEPTADQLVEIAQVQAAVDEAQASRLSNNVAFSTVLDSMLVDAGVRMEAGGEGAPRLDNVRDLKAAHELGKMLADERSILEGVASPQIISGDRQVEDTARVRIAKQQGGSVLAAISEDVRELRVILDGLAASEDQQAVELELLEGGEPAEEAM